MFILLLITFLYIFLFVVPAVPSVPSFFVWYVFPALFFQNIIALICFFVSFFQLFFSSKIVL